VIIWQLFLCAVLKTSSWGQDWGFVDDTFEQKPFIMLGGMARLSEKLWLVSENWIAPVDDNN
jgi:hypothetical protein